MKYFELIGRILYSYIFLMTITSHFSAASAAYAASKGVPVPGLFVPLSGILAFSGALSIIAGLKARWGAWLIVIFLMPVTYMMHDFWNISDPAHRQIQSVMFIKNISLLGAALIIAYSGTGPLSLDRRLKINSKA